MSNDGYAGTRDNHSGSSEFNALSFLVNQLMGKMATATLVQVKAADPAAQTVDVQPMVALVDGLGNATPHGTVFGLPYMRLQGGANAVIIDPQVGDIGVAVFASSDISSVKVSRKPANPGSFRRFDMADGLYLGGFLNGTPTQVVEFTGSGITLRSPGTITLDAPTVQVTGTLDATTDVTTNGVSLKTHRHGGVTAGGGTSGTPVP